MAGSSYSYDKSSPFFSTEDVDDATFLGSGRRAYESSTIDERRQQLLEEKKKIETRTLESSFRSLSLLHESEQIGNATAEELTRQREQLQSTEHKLDQINSSLRTSQKHIQGIKSVFGSIRNYFSSSSKPETTAIKTSASTSELDNQSTPRSKLADILENSAEPPRDTLHPTERLRSEVVHETKEVDDLLDRNLDMMGSSLSRLKMLGLGLQDEMEEQNELVDRISRKTEDVDFKMTQQTKDMNRILKK
ncbi:unnamed protein product [Orchesella dallaii]|uniref:t-SNARE coiled-coil homology domain-containing protein n=1 Tax=Orchesella dallaii TaxID=48710 RepID=A0ABP1RL09_9HEXA